MDAFYRTYKAVRDLLRRFDLHVDEKSGRGMIREEVAEYLESIIVYRDYKQTQHPETAQAREEMIDEFWDLIAAGLNPLLAFNIPFREIVAGAFRVAQKNDAKDETTHEKRDGKIRRKQG